MVILATRERYKYWVAFILAYVGRQSFVSYRIYFNVIFIIKFELYFIFIIWNKSFLSTISHLFGYSTSIPKSYFLSGF